MKATAILKLYIKITLRLYQSYIYKCTLEPAPPILSIGPVWDSF